MDDSAPPLEELSLIDVLESAGPVVVVSEDELPGSVVVVVEDVVEVLVVSSEVLPSAVGPSSPGHAVARQATATSGSNARIGVESDPQPRLRREVECGVCIGGEGTTRLGFFELRIWRREEGATAATGARGSVAEAGAKCE